MTRVLPPTAVPASAVPNRRTFWQRLRKHRSASGALAVVVLFIFCAVFAALISPYDPVGQNVDATLLPPGSGHPFGTDEFGRDVLSRVVYGARVSLEAGLIATLLAMAVATPVGLLAGYFRGFTDTVFSRLTDVLLAFPSLIVAIGLAAILGPSLMTVTIALGVAQIPAFIRVIRGEVLAVRGLDYVKGAVIDGAGDITVMRRYVLPNVLAPMIVQATVAIPTCIIGESLLSFLGVGVQPPKPSWGSMLSASQGFLTQAPWLSIIPGLAIVLATLSFNLLGDGLRDILDPRKGA
jgi:peptide/nickel transport system permease protein